MASRRLFIIEVAALATIVVSVFIVALVLFYMWAELEGRGALVPLLLAFRRTASLCGFFALSHIFDGPLR
jgi:hypothetical protein